MAKRWPGVPNRFAPSMRTELGALAPHVAADRAPAAGLTVDTQRHNSRKSGRMKMASRRDRLVMGRLVDGAGTSRSHCSKTNQNRRTLHYDEGGRAPKGHVGGQVGHPIKLHLRDGGGVTVTRSHATNEKKESLVLRALCSFGSRRQAIARRLAQAPNGQVSSSLSNALGRANRSCMRSKRMWHRASLSSLWDPNI